MRFTVRRLLALTGLGALGTASYARRSMRLEEVRTRPPDAEPSPRLRVAFVTDLHAPFHTLDEGDLIDRIRRFAPDLLLVGGDSIEDPGDEWRVGLFGAVEAPLGKFAVLGNWEYQGCDIARLRRAYEEAGVRLLVNERVVIDADQPLELIGLDDWRGGSPDYELLRTPGAAQDAASGGPRRLVLSHCPITFDAVARLSTRPAHVFSGHTHGGQIAPFGVAIVRPPGSGRYVRGWYRSTIGDHWLYVSRGLGCSGITLRIGAAPELSLITL